MALSLARGVKLPPDAVTRSFGFLGMKGSGKSNGAVVLAEELWKEGIPWIAIDVKGDWWGMKSSKDGDGPGLPVIVFGGEHQDVALEPSASGGTELAEAIIGEGLTCILDLSDFTKGQKIEFLAGRGNREGFAERLFRRKKREGAPMHIFMEEAHDYVPQRATGEVGKMIEVVGRFQTMGRQRGFGCSVLSQRSARVHKDVLNQIDTLFAFRTIAPHDRKAILEWVKGHGLAEELVSSLPELGDGEAWMWSPEWMRDLKKFKWRRRTTYDSGATPTTGDVRRKPVTMADVDLQALQDRMASAIEKAKEEDPQELRKVIAGLRKELRTASKEKPAEVKEVEVPIVPPDLIEELKVLREHFQAHGESLDSHAEALGDYRRESALIGAEVEAVLEIITKRSGRSRTPRKVPTRQTQKARSRAVPKERDVHHEDISRSQARILDTLAWLEGIDIPQPSKTQVAIFVSQSPTSGGYANNLGRLRSAGLIEYPSPGLVELTAEGRQEASPPDLPPTTEALHGQLFQKVSKSQAAILEVLIREYPEPVQKDALAEEVGLSPTSGGYANNLGRLRSLGLIDYPSPGYAAAEPVLFLEETG